MIKICLCDDEKDSIEFYTKVINDITKENDEIIEVEAINSGESLIFSMDNNPNKYDIIILDIFMNNINGIETAKLIRKIGYSGILIFLTNTEEYAIDSFEVEPFNYILKNKEDSMKFEKCIAKAIKKLKNDTNDKIVISTGKVRKILNLKNILYIESINKKLLIYSIDNKVDTINETLSNIEEILCSCGFVRCHKSYIVNIRYIESFSRFECIVYSQKKIPIGRKYLGEFKNKLLEHEIKDITF